MDKRYSNIVFHNARLIDPLTNLDKMGSLLVTDGIISDIKIGELYPKSNNESKVIDCKGNVLSPGLIDMWVFAGEPGYEHIETLEGVSNAAASGGITTLVCRPDTNPIIDDVALVDYIERRAKEKSLINIHPIAALTKGFKGLEMTEIGLLSEAGALAFSDGYNEIKNARVMRNALTYTKNFDALIMQHNQNKDLSDHGVMNEGKVSLRLGLPGSPAASEIISLERDIRLLELTRSRYHALSISTRGSLDVIRKAKELQLNVTTGISINNLMLNENDIGAYRTFHKLRPPLRTEEDRVSMIEALSNSDLLDVIISSHDPQDTETKRRPFIEAGYGAVGLETLLPAALSIYQENLISLPKLLEKMTINPAKILKLDTGRIAKGYPADIVLFNPDTPWVVIAENLISKCRNTAFEKKKMQGKVVMTMVNGKIIYEAK